MLRPERNPKGCDHPIHSLGICSTVTLCAERVPARLDKTKVVRETPCICRVSAAATSPSMCSPQIVAHSGRAAAQKGPQNGMQGHKAQFFDDGEARSRKDAPLAAAALSLPSCSFARSASASASALEIAISPRRPSPRTIMPLSMLIPFSAARYAYRRSWRASESNTAPASASHSDACPVL